MLEQLQSLFPGRIVRVEPLEKEASELDEDEAQGGLFD